MRKAFIVGWIAAASASISGIGCAHQQSTKIAHVPGAGRLGSVVPQSDSTRADCFTFSDARQYEPAHSPDSVTVRDSAARKFVGCVPKDQRLEWAKVLTPLPAPTPPQ